MIEFILSKIIDGTEFAANNSEYEKAKYALEVIKENIIRFIITGTVAIILNIWWHFLFFAIVYGIIKTHAYGIHMKSSILCTIYGIITYFGSIFLSIMFDINEIVYTISFVIGFMIHLRYAPAVSKWQWVENGRIKRLKCRLTIIIIFMFIIQYFLPYINRNLVLCALLSSSLNILPISFRIFES